MKNDLRWTILFLPLLLSGCSGLLPHSEPVDIYRLPTAHTVARQADQAPVRALQLRVNTPQATGMLASKRIVVVPENNRVSVYHGARWNQPAPQMLRDRIIQTFRDSGRLHAVVSDDNNLHVDYTLSGTLNAFQAEYRGQKTPSIVISFDALLVRTADQDVVASHHFDIINPTTDTAIPAIVDALGKATDTLDAELTHWVFEQMAETKDSPPKP